MTHRILLPAGSRIISEIEGPAVLECADFAQVSFLADQCQTTKIEEPPPSEASTADHGLALKAGAFYADVSPVWRMHSGGRRHRVGDWRYPGDHNEATRAVGLFSANARAVLSLGVENAGILMAAEWIAEELELENHHSVAAIMNGFSRGCDKVGRSYPVTWWRHPEDADGRGALYGVRPEWTKLFEGPLQALTAPISVRSDRWHTELVPALLRLIVEGLRNDQPLRYKDTATELNSTVPGARVNFRVGMSHLLYDLQTGLNIIDEDLPLVTAGVVDHTGRPADRFYELATSLGRQWTDKDDFARHHQRLTAELTDERVEELTEHLAEPEIVEQVRATLT
jgi:hypothetical protein